MLAQDLTIVEGDDKTYHFTFQDNDENEIDVTGYEIFFTAKEVVTDPDAGARITVQSTIGATGASGYYDFLIPHGDTDGAAGAFTYDFQLVSNDTPSYVTTLMKGTLTILEDVTIDIT